MQVEKKIDHLSAKSPQTGFAGNPDSFRPTINTYLAMLIADETELCR